MTTVTTTDRTSLNANGTAALPFTFQSLSATEVGVRRKGVEQVLTTNFTVTRNGDGTGSVTPTSTWGTDAVVIYSKPSLLQSANFTRFGAWYPDQMNAPMDRAARTAIALKGQLDALDLDVIPRVGGAMVGGGTASVSYNPATGKITVSAPQPFVVGSGTAIDDYPLPVVTPEQMGAIHTAGVDDGPALALAAAAIVAAGGGLLYLKPGATYWVGSQVHNGAVPTGTYTWAPVTYYSLNFFGCTKPVIVMGNGATIKCLAGKKYGSFNDNGSARADASPYYGVGLTGLALSTPYGAMVNVENCTGSFHIQDIELDGNIGAQTIGGVWGDVGRQVPMSGIIFKNNTGQITTRNLYAHHHGLDGGIGDGPGLLSTRESVVIHGKFVNNGRQAFSLVGGNAWHFDACVFNGTGKNIGGMTYSPPGAGIDIEAEGGKYVVKATFDKCLFSDNTGPGMLSDVNAFVRGAVFRACKFVGTTGWSIWPANQGFKFDDCTLVGAIVNLYGSDDISKTTQFDRSVLTDEAALSPTGTVYIVTGAIVSGGSDKVVWNDCLIRKTDNTDHSSNGNQGNLATGAGMKLNNCTIENISNKALSVFGIFSGERTKLIDVSAVPVVDTLAATLSVTRAGPSFDSFLYGHTINGFSNPEARYGSTVDRRTGLADFSDTAAPTTGTWAKGDRVRNSNPTSGGYVGWICTVAGTPGTWKGFGAIA